MKIDQSAISRLVLVMLCLLGTWQASQAQSVIPIDNPYKTRYGTEGHWTDSLPWQKVWQIADFGVMPNDGLADDSLVALALDSLAATGGGVMYFSGGVYDFKDHLLVPNGVILRGDNPLGVQDARQPGYTLTTRFEFPQYIFDTLANNGAGTANSTAFKRVMSKDGRVSNAGIVNIDLNRAGISFRSEYLPGPVMRTVTRNIIVWGTRTNNVADPSPWVPEPTFQKPWQRHSYVFTSNISVMVNRNAVVANNLVNDLAGYGGQDDSFGMDNYVIKTWPFRGYELLPATKAIFCYTDHHGISVNRKSAPTSATPEQEPALFAEGIEILHNWVYHTMRNGIAHSGLNPVIKGNVIRDKQDKVTWLHPLGQETPKNANTFENRGIDVSGWGARIDSNDLVVYRHRINNGPFYSVDGEGILHQACCGGTTVNGYQITNNTTNGTFISIFYSGDIHNAYVANNNLGGPLKLGQQTGSIIWINADPNAGGGQIGYLNNVVVENNYNIDNNAGMGCIVTGSKGGHNAIVRNNSMVGTPTTAPGPNLTISCYVQESNNNLSGVRIQNNGGSPCPTPTQDLPVISWQTPQTDTTLCDTTHSPLNLKIKVANTDPSLTTAELYLGNTVLVGGLMPDQDSIITTPVSLPAGNGRYSLTLFARYGQNLSMSYPLVVTKACSVNVVTSVEPGILSTIQFWPNPAHEQIRIAGVTGTASLKIINLLGQTLVDQSLPASGEITISQLPKGVYTCLIRSGRQTAAKRFLKE